MRHLLSSLPPLRDPTTEWGTSPRAHLGGQMKSNHELMSCDDDNFLLMFNSTFPLPQGSSWTMFRLNNKLSMLVISELCTGPSNLGSWLRFTKNGGSIGRIGTNLPQIVKWTQNSKTLTKRPRSKPSLPLLNRSGQAIAAGDIKCELKRFKSCFAPSRQRANWTDSLTPSTGVKDDTSGPSNAK